MGSESDARILRMATSLIGLLPHSTLAQAPGNVRKQEHPTMPQDAKSDLAPTGVLRAGINLSNFLLVTGKSAAGDPEGVAPDMAREIAGRLGVPVKYVPYKTPGELADMADTGAWDIGLIGAEPQRAEKITFTAAYVEIEATYLVPAGSGLKAIADVDKAGVRIGVTGRSAYGLWLDRNIKHATLVRSDTLDSAYDQFIRDKLSNTKVFFFFVASLIVLLQYGPEVLRPTVASLVAIAAAPVMTASAAIQCTSKRRFP